MPLNLSAPHLTELKPRISVIGVGGAGGNAVNNMINDSLEGVEFVVANTDAQAVALSSAVHKVQLGTNVTQGLGAGSRPEIGCAAAEESLEDVLALIEGSNMLFITAGMGGGTGTGAAPVIAKAARERGILTVGVVTKPFQFEGARRMRLAEEGILALQEHVDTLLIIPNQNLFRLADENTTMMSAFAMADEVLYAGVRGITDLMIVPGLINLDFADVRAVMSEMGKAMMGTGEANGENRASNAAIAAISNPLLDETSLQGAKGVLINITGGQDMKLFEVDEAANRIRAEVDPEANIIVGSTFSQELEGTMRVSVVATGIERMDADAEKAIISAPSIVETGSAQPASAASKSEDIIAPLLFEADETAPADQNSPSAQSDSDSVPLAPAAVFPEATEADPVGDVHAHIRRMLTEDNAVALHESNPPQAQRPNPFRLSRTGSPIETAMSLLRDTFANRQQPSQPTAKPARDPFADDDPEDLEIPAFLRRGGRPHN